MTMRQGFAAAYFELPKLRTTELSVDSSLGVMAEQEDILKGQKAFILYHVLVASRQMSLIMWMFLIKELKN